MKAEQNRHCSASIQTLPEPVHPGSAVHVPPRQFEETAVILADRFDQMAPSPVAKPAPLARPRAHTKRDGETGRPLHPVNRNGPGGQRTDPSSRGAEGVSRGDDGRNFQRRLHEMSVLLKRLENQIDGVNEPYTAVE
jgi:hypothetical protein